MTATKTTGGGGVGKPAPAGASPNTDWMNPDEIAAYARRPATPLTCGCSATSSEPSDKEPIT